MFKQCQHTQTVRYHRHHCVTCMFFVAAVALHIGCDDSGGDGVVEVGVEPSITFDVNQLVFPQLELGQEETLNVAIRGTGKLLVERIAVRGPDAESFGLSCTQLPPILLDDATSFECSVTYQSSRWQTANADATLWVRTERAEHTLPILYRPYECVGAPFSYPVSLTEGQLATLPLRNCDEEEITLTGVAIDFGARGPSAEAQGVSTWLAEEYLAESTASTPPDNAVRTIAPDQLIGWVFFAENTGSENLTTLTSSVASTEVVVAKAQVHVLSGECTDDDNCTNPDECEPDCPTDPPDECEPGDPDCPTDPPDECEPGDPDCPTDPPDGECTSPQLGDLIINEVLTDPPPDLSGDANGDGIRDSHDDEFVEIVNISNRPVLLEGISLRRSERTEAYTMEAQMCLPPAQALVVFGGGDPTGFAYSDVDLIPLPNFGDDDLLLYGRDNEVLDSVALGFAADTSSVRSPELDRSATLVEHVTYHGTLYSPGTCADGSPFSSGCSAE